jgi:hypothetical protein
MLRAALRRFAVDPQDPLLRTHKLKGDLEGYWAFSVDDDLRVLFRWSGDEGFLVNLGSHDGVLTRQRWVRLGHPSATSKQGPPWQCTSHRDQFNVVEELR